MRADEPDTAPGGAPAVAHADPAPAPVQLAAADGVLLSWLLTREAFHLRATIRQTSGRDRKRAFSRLRQVQELLSKFGGPYAHA